jgi:nucleoid-associated protein YgaU
VTPEGQALVAGRAAPGARVTLLVEAEPVAEVTAEADGSFVAFFTAPPSPLPQALTLSAADTAGTRASAEVVLLLPKAPASPAPGVLVAPDTADAVLRDGAPVAATERPAAGDAADTETATARAGVAAVILGPEGAEVVQPAGGATGAVSLAAVAYDTEGRVVLSGRGVPGARLRAYVDGAFALDGAVDGEGRWRLTLGDIEGGVYQLRIDALGPDGAVTSQVETPFQRDFPETAAEPVPEGAVVVQPGNNLWTLARIHYGEGPRYMQIFTANREMIRDPDLIYPGQIFVLPEDDGSQ